MPAHRKVSEAYAQLFAAVFFARQRIPTDKELAGIAGCAHETVRNHMRRLRHLSATTKNPLPSGGQNLIELFHAVRQESIKTEAERHARTDESRRIFRPMEVDRLCGFSSNTRYRLEAAGRFPKRIKLSERASAYFCDEVEAWLASRPRALAAQTISQ